MKPLLFLDVDGPLNPYMSMRKPPEGYTKHRMTPTGFPSGLPVLLNHDHGRHLMDLPYELVWGTTWEHEANEWIGPHLGLPELPVVEFGEAAWVRGQRTHWKVEKLIEYANGRPFVWVDDECSSHDWELIQKEHGPHGDIYRVSEITGLRSADWYLLRKKAEEVTAACERASRSQN